MPLPSALTPQTLAEIITWLLAAAALCGVLARILHLPYAVVLVVGGMLIGTSGLVPVPRLDPSFLLFLLLPPLLFDAAFRLDVAELRGLLEPVVFLAVPGTLITALVVGVIVAVVLHLPLPIGLLFGSVVAATDPVAVVAVFRQLGVSGRLSVIAEAESLLNDGVSITLYTVLLGVALGAASSLPMDVALFAKEAVGGFAAGCVLGLVFSRLTGLIDDHLQEMVLSMVLAYGSYLVASGLGVSGALASVAAGLIHGSYGRSVGMSETTRQHLDELWEFLGFLANGVLFLQVGFTVSPLALAQQARPVLVAVVSVLLARAAVMAIPPTLLRPRLRTSNAERTVLLWGGLRGALTIALALALPIQTPFRDLLVAMAFGVVLFTLVAQGASLSWVVRRLGLAKSD